MAMRPTLYTDVTVAETIMPVDEEKEAEIRQSI